jgi:hypothetical protein
MGSAFSSDNILNHLRNIKLSPYHKDIITIHDNPNCDDLQSIPNRLLNI